MSVEFRVISIGTLAAHPLWNEPHDVRTGHATTTLVSAGDAHVLVDPGLPAPILEARLSERTPVHLDDITHVFLTSFTPQHCRALARFEDAAWLVHEPELEVARETIEDEDGAALLRRCTPAADRIVDGVDLFPLPGVTPGACGLLLPLPTTTVVICGDAVATVEHIREGKVLPTCTDIELAQESFREALEIADVLVPGRDNLVPNPLRRML